VNTSFKIPNYVTHYYRHYPFRSLTNLNEAERDRVIDQLDFPANASHRFHSSYYFDQRLRYETLMHEQFTAKGGCPTLSRPHYAILGDSEIWEKISNKSIRIPIAELKSEHISFTYTDSWMTYVHHEHDGQPIPRKHQYDTLYRLEELPELFANFGWPGDRWKTEHEWENDIYVEAQIWDEQCLDSHISDA
jgi:hypothetical protein